MAIHRSTDADGLTITFVLIYEDPTAPVSVVGSFNDWTPGTHPFEADPDGSRSVTVVVPAGEDVYFRYLGPDGYWFDDPDADEITAEGSVLRTAPASEVATESASETTDQDAAPATPATPAAPAAASDQVSGTDADHQPAPAGDRPSDTPSDRPDETGERLEAVADRIDAAKDAARELVDDDVLDGDAVKESPAPHPA